MSNVEKAICNLANETLKESKISIIPVPVTEIAKYYGFSVFEGEMEKGESGLILISDKKLDRFNNNKIIMINRNEVEVRKRFTIAHEIGHYLLNDKPQKCYAHRETGKRDFEEVMADSFASHLLMPEKPLKEYILKLRYDSWEYFQSDTLIYAISRHFLVSKDAARVRLEKLGEV